MSCFVSLLIVVAEINIFCISMNNPGREMPFKRISNIIVSCTRWDAVSYSASECYDASLQSYVCAM